MSREEEEESERDVNNRSERESGEESVGENKDCMKGVRYGEVCRGKEKQI